MVFLISLFLSPLAAADSWLMSIPYALSSEHVYKIRIEQIDGARVADELRYPISAGEHTVTVSLVLDVEWSPDLVENPNDSPRSKQLIINAETGKTYQVAGEVDVEASIESQLDQSYWSPFIYAVQSD